MAKRQQSKRKPSAAERKARQAVAYERFIFDVDRAVKRGKPIPIMGSDVIKTPLMAAILGRKIPFEHLPEVAKQAIVRTYGYK